MYRKTRILIGGFLTSFALGSGWVLYQHTWPKFQLETTGDEAIITLTSKSWMNENKATLYLDNQPVSSVSFEHEEARVSSRSFEDLGLWAEVSLGAPTNLKTDLTFDGLVLSWDEVVAKTTCHTIALSLVGKAPEQSQEVCQTMEPTHYEVTVGGQTITTKESSWFISNESLVGEQLSLQVLAMNDLATGLSSQIDYPVHQLSLSETYELQTTLENGIFELLESPLAEGVSLTEPFVTHLEDGVDPIIETLTVQASNQGLTVNWDAYDLGQAYSWYVQGINEQGEQAKAHLQGDYVSGISRLTLRLNENDPVSVSGSSYTFKSVTPGTYTVTLTIEDGNGNSTSKTSAQVEVEQPKTSQSTTNAGITNALQAITSRHEDVPVSTYNQLLTGASSVVPSAIFESLKQHGTQIEVVPDSIRDYVRNKTGWDAGWNYQGVTFSDCYGLYSQIFTSVKGGTRIFVHEIGHAYDHYLGRPSGTSEFESVYDQEAYGLLGGGLYTSNYSEYFAETFRMYWMDRQTLQTKAPQTYSFLQQRLP